MTYKASTIWVTMLMMILVALCMIGGYFERGYIAFDSSFIILILSPVIISYWYKSEKERYNRRRVK
jgi:ABC-type thiamin/hydroxymethylpyrimidine transport system permease subunit